MRRYELRTRWHRLAVSWSLRLSVGGVGGAGGEATHPHVGKSMSGGLGGRVELCGSSVHLRGESRGGWLCRVGSGLTRSRIRSGVFQQSSRCERCRSETNLTSCLSGCQQHAISLPEMKIRVCDDDDDDEVEEAAGGEGGNNKLKLGLASAAISPAVVFSS